MVPWANGLGTTSVVARWPDDDSWVWRLSLADVTTDGPFSSLPGIDRFIVVASGAGMELTIGDAPAVQLTVASPPFAFDGGADVMCHLIDGPIVDLNLMARSGTPGSIVVHHLADGERLDLESDVIACVVLTGSVQADEDMHWRHDAIIDPDAGTSLTAREPTRLALVIGQLRRS